MKKPHYFIFILVILLAFSLGACTRSASQPPSEEEEGGMPLPTLGTQEPMSMLEEMATQTAMAQEAGGGEEAPAAETPTEEAPAEGEAGEETPAESEAGEGETPAETEEETGGGQEPVVTPKEYEVPDSYTLRAGEFPFCIARRFDISPAALLNANGLSINSSVYPGTKLTIPKNAASFDAGSRALRSHPINYTVVSGDTVYSIACLFGDVDPRAIEEVNGLSGAYTLSSGQVIKIP